MPANSNAFWISIASLLSVLTLLLGGAITGFFYAYSVSVMRGLDFVAPQSAIIAMQGINATVRNALFAPAFFGTPVAAIAAGAVFLIMGHKRAGLALLAAAAVYILGAFVPTFAINVPMNNELATIDAATAAQPEQIWRDYSDRWTWWNHLRTIFSALSLALVGLAIFFAGRDFFPKVSASRSS